MKPQRLEEVRALIALAALTPGEAADRAGEWLELQSKCAGLASEILDHVSELEAQNRYLRRRVETILEIARNAASERDRARAALDLESDRVDGALYRALQQRLRLATGSVYIPQP